MWYGIACMALLKILLASTNALLVLADGYAAPHYSPEEAQGRNGAVAAEATACSQIGLELLKANGSAVDAAIGAALCQGIVYPFSSGIGGGGVMLIKHVDRDEAVFIDFRETAPSKSTQLMFLNASSVLGGMSVAVPGELRGLEEAHKRYGNLPWKDVVAPAVRLARDGHVVTNQLALRLKRRAVDVISSAGLSSEYMGPSGTLAREGQLLRHPKLAVTLQRVADSGANAFYTGEIAHNIVNTVQRDGGILTEEDLAGYRPTVQTALKGSVFNHTLYFTQPPTSGAVAFHTLKLMETFKATEFSPQYAHHLTEAFKLGYAGRSLLGDPAFIDATKEVEFLTNPANLESQLSLLSESQTFEPKHYFKNISPSLNKDTHGTSHISSVDSYGLTVSMTTTVNLEFGSKLLCPTTGVLLNNEMDDFSTPGKPNYFGLEPSQSNYIEPGKRPFSSMSPLIMQGKDDVIIIGAAGGSRITTSVVQTILNLLQLNHTLTDAVALGRLHHQLAPNEIRLESSAFEPSLIDSLRSQNHTIVTFDIPESVVNVIQARRLSTTSSTPWSFSAVTDPRKGGTAAAF
ncbi:hypothetical protein DSO57_1018762 [Entomophthora muscae]|uniref:Uncharacterized protein n=1 Tax=Entomophthora muscae TaxID=34485 RepID=A0ACC2TRU8_9FUNG|nr:hypothetical protein DSO57_1018762 [Entomophthora muscae]